MSRKTAARERLLDFISLAEAANDGTTPDQLVDDAISEALFNQPSLRNCLLPGCMRQQKSIWRHLMELLDDTPVGTPR
jgi:hypothetical protein